MKRLSTVLAIAVLLSLMLPSCYYDKEEELYPSIGTVCDTTDVTFTRTIAPILASFCYGCHSNPNAPSFGNNIKLENYGDVISILPRVVGSVLHQGDYSPMPKNSGALTICAQNQFAIWQRRGAPQ